MMTKHRLAYLAAAAIIAAMPSCSDDDIDAPSASRKISFEVSAAEDWSRADSRAAGVSLSTLTLQSGDSKLYLIPEASRSSRGEAVTAESIADFGVYASAGAAGAYYMDNVQVTKANSWAPRAEYLWPGDGSLHINAYSPYCAAPDAESGITALPSSDVSTTPTLSYTVPSDVTKQIDLMRATPRDASSSPCELTFNHALAAVKFVAGSEMKPCTIKSVTIAGLCGSGTLDLESGAWTDLSGHESYTADVDAELPQASGSEYAEAGAEITDAAHTFMLLPQALTDDATVTIALDCEGVNAEYTASLSGQRWAAGNTYTYHISANPATDRFVIDVTSPLSFNYPGGTASFAVKSIRQTASGDSEVPWIAEFVDDAGHIIPAPSWITSLDTAGNGSGDYSASTSMVEPTFIHMSEPTRLLREQPEVGTATAPYNLANSTGAPGVENTANCYVINAPGTYSIPLVYGNAIKNGADNTAAYAPTRSSATFVNHLNNRIKHPYIYDNDGCKPAGAVLVWEGRLNMIHDLSLSADGKSLVFNIPRAYIRQGNAVVGITDAAGDIIWSWQLWITDYVPGTDMSTLSYSGKSFDIMPYNMGYVVGGDEVDFDSNSALVRFTQKPADGSEGGSVTITVQQTGKHIITPDCYSFYQWGRKDPMISGIKEWYYADHTEITSIDTRSVPMTGGKIDTDFEALCVKYPQAFWVAGASHPTFRYSNNWNAGTATRPVKTVYDPCPVGFMVPGNELMAFRDLDNSRFSFTSSAGISSPAGFNVTSDSGQSLFFPALGYRSGNTGSETIADATGGSLTALWTSHANTREASALVLDCPNGEIKHTIPSDPRLEAFAVRPIRE